MNNSKIALESITLVEEEVIDLTPILRSKEEELLAILEALEQINSSDYWRVLKEKLFNKELDSLYRQLRNERNPTVIYRLQGKLDQADKYDLDKQYQATKVELQNVRSKLDGRTAT